MSTVGSILRRKGGEVVTIGPDESALRAASLMNQRAIGGLVVMEEGVLAGIVTERDILRRIVAAQRNPSLTTVRSIMSWPVFCCRPETSLADCQTLMTGRRIRHLPVLDDQGICGIVTIGDLLAHEVGEKEVTIEQLHSYIQGGR